MRKSSCSAAISPNCAPTLSAKAKASRRHNMRFPLVLALFAVQTGSVHAGGAPPLEWWVASSLEKIRPADAEPARAVHAARLFAARNEFESFQIVLRADAAGASDVDIDISDLRASHGREISRNNITIYAERFIDLSRASAS